MSTYVCQVDVTREDCQNSQELVSLWGDIRNDIEELGGSVVGTYLTFGEHDFHLVFEMPDEGTAFQATQVVERRGLDTHTMQAIPIEEMGAIVDDS